MSPASFRGFWRLRLSIFYFAFCFPLDDFLDLASWRQRPFPDRHLQNGDSELGRCLS